MQIEQLFWIAVGLGAASAALALYLAARLRAVREALDGRDESLRAAQAQAELAAQEARAHLVELTQAKTRLEAETAAREEWERTRAEFMNASRAAVMGAANELSNKLLADHKRENAQAKEEAEKRVKETTALLMQQYERVSASMQVLDQQMRENRSAVETITRALSSPGGAGRSAETVLENTLKAFGLREGQDYLLQYSMQGESGGRLRPDALVFLPGNAVMVIDAKATKHLMDLADAADETAEAEHYTRIRSTMNQHLRGLVGKDYQNAVLQEYRRTRPEIAAPRVISMMWLPNEGAIEKVQSADPDFQRRCAECSILLVGPSGLWAAIGIAAQNIQLNRQVENHERIMDGMRDLIDRIAVVVRHAGSLGKALRQASQSYSQFESSVNGRLLPGIRRVLRAGLPAPAKMPEPLPSYQFVQTETLIEADSEEEERQPRLLPPDGA